MIAPDDALLHNTWLAGILIVGVGFTVILNVLLLPVQLLAEGVTTIAATTGAPPVLLPVKGAILPVPADARPMEPAELVQL